MSGWAAFWLAVTVFFLVDTAVSLKGYDTFFWAYKISNELAAQRRLLGVDSAGPAPKEEY